MNTDPLELLGDESWLRRLALRLARDSATAEDLLQELRLRAWQHAPPDPARRGPWLVHVLHNLARKERRGAERRSARERATVPDTAVPAPHEVAARLEAQRTLLEEVTALDEPFRTALVLRYHDELEPKEIARRLSVPAGTVRWRLHEGLSRLRERLENRHGGREAWLRACAPLFPRAGAWPFLPTASTLWIALAMNTATKLGAAAAALGLIAVPVWLAARSESPRSTPPPETVTRAAASELEAPVLAAPPLDSAPVARTAEHPAPAETRAAEPAPSEARTRIEGRVLDERQRPIADGSARAPEVRGARAACASDGRFSLALEGDFPANELLDLRIEAPLRATRVLAVRAFPGQSVQVGDVVLGAGARVAGLVRTARGEPAAGVRVVVAHPSASASTSTLGGPVLEPESASALTDAAGRFACDDAPAGLVLAWACRPEVNAREARQRSAWACSEVFELAPGGAREDLVLVLPGEGSLAATAIAGVVRTPLGAPVPRAELRVAAETSDATINTGVVADESGAFLYDPQRPCVAELVAADPAGAWRPARVSGVRGGTHEVEIVLAEPRWLVLSVHAPGGAAPAAFEVLESRVLEDGKRLGPSVHAAENGRARLSVPLDRFLLEVKAPGFALARLGPFEPDSAPAELECTLEALPGLRGRVLHAGAPVAGAVLELRRLPRPTQHPEMHGFPQRVWCEVEERTTSDAEGNFVLAGRQAGERVLQCVADGFALAELGPLSVDPARGASALDLTLTRGGTLEGSVRVAPGLDPAGIIVGANRFDGHARTQRADEQGRFRFEILAPGPWRIERVRAEMDPSDDSYTIDERPDETPRERANCTVTDGETTTFVLDLSSERPARVSAHLVVDGSAGDGWSVDLWPVGVNTWSGELPGGRLDGQGRVVFETDPGRYLVRFHDLSRMDFDGVAQLELDLPPGETPIEAAFETGALEGRWLDDPSDLIAVWSARTKAGYTSHSFLLLDDEGRFHADVLLAGPGELVVQHRASGAEVMHRSIEIVPGKRATVELP